jgi:hypothetical protein
MCNRHLPAITVLIFAYGTDDAIAQGPTFTDVTNSAGIASMHVPRFLESRAAGGAVGDFNRDGFQDVFHAVGGGAPDRLFINNGDGTFTDRAAQWGIAVAQLGTGALVGDFDRDGLLDLYVASLGTTAGERPHVNVLYRNESGVRFTNVAAAMGVNSNGGAPDSWTGAFGDHDLDGDLDLAVAGWRSGQNRLFRNNGGTSFTDVSAASGVFPSLITSSGSCARFVDMDGDRDPELIFIADFGTSRYFRNNGNGTFTNFTAASGTGIGTTERACAIADFDENGAFDFFVAARGFNYLQMNQGSNVFTNIGVAAGVSSSGMAWGAVAADFDNDTWVDLFVTSESGTQYLFRNVSTSAATPRFSNVAATAGITTTVSGRAVANLDYDNDGDQDLLIFAHAGPLVLYRNDSSGANRNWLRVVLDHGSSVGIAPDGIGTIVRATVGARSWSRVVDAGSNYLSNSELTAHFGLGAATSVDVLRIEWPDGRITTMQNLAANRTLLVRAPANSAGVTSIGSGCAGSNGVPFLSPRAGSRPVLGTNLIVDLTRLVVGGPPAAILLALDRRWPGLELGPIGASHCAIHVEPALAVSIVVPNLASAASLTLAIPNDPALIGGAFYLQGVSLDAAANSLGIAVSNALQAVMFP